VQAILNPAKPLRDGEHNLRLIRPARLAETGSTMIFAPLGAAVKAAKM
jgi:hypothetical protein